MLINPKGKLLAVLDHAEEYRVLAVRSRYRGEREGYERIVELYVRIAEEIEALIDGRAIARMRRPRRSRSGSRRLLFGEPFHGV